MIYVYTERDYFVLPSAVNDLLCDDESMYSLVPSIPSVMDSHVVSSLVTIPWSFSVSSSLGFFCLACTLFGVCSTFGWFRLRRLYGVNNRTGPEAAAMIYMLFSYSWSICGFLYNSFCFFVLNEWRQQMNCKQKYFSIKSYLLESSSQHAAHVQLVACGVIILSSISAWNKWIHWNEIFS